MDAIIEKDQMHSLPVDRMCQALSLSRATYYRYIHDKENPNHCASHDSAATPSNAMTGNEGKITSLFSLRRPGSHYNSILVKHSKN